MKLEKAGKKDAEELQSFRTVFGRKTMLDPKHRSTWEDVSKALLHHTANEC